MVSVLVCCSEMMAVAGWLVATLAAGRVEGRPDSIGRPSVAWHVAGEGRGTPALFDGVVFFLSRRHELVAIDAASGRERWRRSTGGPGETTAGSLVVAAAGHIVAGDGDVVGFSTTGAERWRFRARDDGMAGVYLGEASEGLVFAGSATGRLWAIRVSSGAVRWSRLVVADGRTTVFAPIVSGRVVAAGFTSFGVRPSGGVAAVDASTGRVRWKAWFPDAASPGGGTAFAGGPVAVDALVLAASQDGAVHAFDGRTGARQWSIAATAPSASGAFEYRALARAGSSVVAASLTGLVTAYDLHTRLVRWRRRVLSASVMFGLATDERAVYVPYLSGDLVALDADDGDPRWRTTPDASGFSWKPLVAAGRVFAASTSAGFFAFHP